MDKETHITDNIKAIIINWTTNEVEHYNNLLSVFAEHRGKINLIFEGCAFSVLSYEDGVLDGIKDGPFEVDQFGSLEELEEYFGAEDQEDLIGIMENEDWLINLSNTSVDDEEFAAALAAY